MDPIRDIVTVANVPHLHLLVNHFPTIGSIIGLGLYILAFARRDDHLHWASLEVLFAIALLTLPAVLDLFDGRIKEARITAELGASEGQKKK